MQHVTIVGFKKALGTSITIPLEMLNAAGLIRRIKGADDLRLQLQLVSVDGNNIELTAGLELNCAAGIKDIESTDLIIIPALWGNPKGTAKQYPSLLQWLQKENKKGTLICAVGTGSYFLAEAGLLQNKVATTHWYYFDQFAKLYPDVLLQRDRFITRSGNLYCAGSVNSVRDVMLHFIEEHFSPEAANQVSRHFTHEIKRSYSSSYLKYSPQNYHDDEGIIAIQEWIHSKYDSDIRIEQIAEHFDFNLRTLNRRFRQATGKSPLQYLQQVRIDYAKELLKTSNLSVAEVANSVGYPDCSYFAAVFRRNISLTPSQYRNLVRKKLFKVDT